MRLRYGFWIKCHDYKTDDAGNVTEITCTYDPATRGGNAPPDGRKVKGTLHWVSETDACEYVAATVLLTTLFFISVELRMYEHLFTTPTPDAVPEGKAWQDFINPNSLRVCKAKGEAILRDAVHPYRTAGVPFQFERAGFFVADYDSRPEAPVFNLTVPLTDSWAAKTDEKSREAQVTIARACV